VIAGLAAVKEHRARCRQECHKYPPKRRRHLQDGIRFTCTIRAHRAAMWNAG
jgi:hypothetical protein